MQIPNLLLLGCLGEDDGYGKDVGKDSDDGAAGEVDGEDVDVGSDDYLE